MPDKTSRILLLTLFTFSATGGIEKSCRVLGKALQELSIEEQDSFLLMSLHDKSEHSIDNSYVQEKNRQSFGGNKFSFVASSIRRGIASEVVVLAHINLIPIAFLIKKFNPKTKIILWAHGIELWQPLKGVKKLCLSSIDKFVAVSDFTAKKLTDVQKISADKITTTPHALDPYILQAARERKPKGILEKYKIPKDAFVLFALTRLAATERHKGYGKVIEAMGMLTGTSARPLWYIIAGKFTEDERIFILRKAKENSVEYKVILPGFVEENELPQLFAIADLYIMPSQKEGFGISFIEAMHFGVPVVAGNVDGSSEALAHGKLGTLINPDSVDEIAKAIIDAMENSNQSTFDKPLFDKLFSFETFKNNWKEVLGKRIMHNQTV